MIIDEKRSSRKSSNHVTSLVVIFLFSFFFVSLPKQRSVIEERRQRVISDVQQKVAEYLKPKIEPKVEKKMHAHRIMLKSKLRLNKKPLNGVIKSQLGLNKKPVKLLGIQETKLMSIVFDFNIQMSNLNLKNIFLETVESSGFVTSSHVIEKRQITFEYVRFQQGTSFQLRFLDAIEKPGPTFDIITCIYMVDLSHLDTYFNHALNEMKKIK